MTVPDSHIEILKQLRDVFDGEDIDWAVTGSTGLALQGMPLEPDDIDIQTDREGAYRIDELLERYRVQGASLRESKNIRSHFGVYEIDGTKIEVMGAVQRYSEGWTEPVEPSEHREHVEVEGHDIPVMELEHEKRAYRELGRKGKASRIEDYLQQ